MAEFKDVRATIRDAEPQRSAGSGNSHIYLAVIAFVGFAIGAGAVLFVPKLSSTTPSTPHVAAAPAQAPAAARDRPAKLPTFAEIRERVARGESMEGAALPPLKPAPLDYSADPEQLAQASDAVCFERSLARFPNYAQRARLSGFATADFGPDEIKHFNELITCLLVQSPVRYCSAAQRSMVTTEIIAYFRGIADFNKRLDLVRPLEAKRRAEGFETVDIRNMEAAPAVVAAIGARLRDGLLTREDFDKIKGSIPERIRNQLAAIPRGPSKCPPPPWWAVWR